jgi:hypothetical protein
VNARVLVIYFKFFESLLGNRESLFESHRPRWSEFEIINRLSASSGFGEDKEALTVYRIKKLEEKACLVRDVRLERRCFFRYWKYIKVSATGINDPSEVTM